MNAPPYAIVRACRTIGYRSPEDVRWCRMTHLPGGSAGWQGLIERQPWGVLSGLIQPGDLACHCGEKLPRLERCTFTFRAGNESSYFIGQCGRCQTLFWEEA